MTAVAIVAVVISAVALALTVAQWLSSIASSSREETRRIAEVGALQEQVGLLRQLIRSLEERAGAGRHAFNEVAAPGERALITARPAGESGSSRGVERFFTLRNVGTGPAIGISLWLALESNGEPMGTESSSVAAIGELVPNDPERKVMVEQPAPFPGGKVPRDGFLVGRWKERDGTERTEVLCLTIVYV